MLWLSAGCSRYGFEQILEPPDGSIVDSGDGFADGVTDGGDGGVDGGDGDVSGDGEEGEDGDEGGDAGGDDFQYTYCGGTGSPGDPYLICTLEHLDQVRYNLDADFRMVNDIDASETSSWNDGDGFVPIGTDGELFAGYFDGNGL